MRGLRSLVAVLLERLDLLVARLPRPLGPVVAAVLRVQVGAARAFEAKRLHRDAAFLAYFGLLSLIPLLGLLVWIAGVLATPLLASPSRMERLRGVVQATTEHAFPFLADQVAALLGEVAAASGAGGLLGLLAMVASAGLLFRALSQSISEVYGLPNPRGFLGARLVAAMAIFAGAVVALGLLTLWETITGLLEGFGLRGLLPVGSGGLLSTLAEAALVVLGFVVVVRVSTRGRMRNRPLLLAGAFFWLSWAFAAQLFGLYLERVPTLSRIYGSLTTVAALLLWTYYTAMMFLFSVCVAAEIGRQAGGRVHG
ncbi:MAG: YhjD/YihY/BrkB family envelope integrity protein [Pseudomonadota bacterium]